MKNKKRIDQLEDKVLAIQQLLKETISALNEGNPVFEKLFSGISKIANPNLKYKVGDWVFVWSGKHKPELVLITKIKDGYFDYKKVSGFEFMCHAEYYITKKAKIEEIEKVLIEYALLIYKVGIKVQVGKYINIIDTIYFKYDHAFYCNGKKIWDIHNGWYEIIKPDFTNSLDEVFYYGDEVWPVNKRTLIIDNVACEFINDNFNGQDWEIFHTKASAEKWVEDNKPKLQVGNYYKVKVDDTEWGIAFYNYNDLWQVTGCKEDYNTDFFLEIGDKIELN